MGFKKKGQEEKFRTISEANKFGLVKQNHEVILDWKISESEFQNFLFVKTSSTGGVL